MVPMNLFLMLLLFVVLVAAPATCPMSLASVPTSSVCPEPSIPAPTSSTCPEPFSPAPSGYGVVGGFPVLFLRPADGWVCRCLLLARPSCSCILDPTIEENSKSREFEVMGQLIVY